MMLLFCWISSGWDSQDPGLPVMTIEHAKITVQPAGHRCHTAFHLSLHSTL